MLNRRILVSAALALAALPTLAPAQQWPAQPIKLIVPFSAGGPTDALARQVARQLQVGFGQFVFS